MKLLPKRERIKVIEKMIVWINKRYYYGGLCSVFAFSSGHWNISMEDAMGAMGFKPPRRKYGLGYWWNPSDKESRLAYLRKELKKLQPKKK